MPRPSPRFFFFDLGNVLLKFDRQIAFRRLAEMSGRTDEQVREVVMASTPFIDYERGELSDAQFVAHVCRGLGVEMAAGPVLQAYSEMFSINVPVMAIVTQLHWAAERLGIISNTCRAHWDYIASGRYTVVPAFFELTVLSFEVGAVKPDPEIFQQAIRQAGVAAEAIFYVDDIPEYVAAAQQLGIDGVVYSTPEQLAHDLLLRDVAINY